MNRNYGPKAPNPAGKPRAAAAARKAPAALPPGLTLTTGPQKSAQDTRNPDPYNTSGSFDRTKNWARVGKR
jgi:hypothetical protein